MARAIVVGAGLSGLASALQLKQCGITEVTVLEKRASHIRDNSILLSHLAGERLRQLGVDYVVRRRLLHGDPVHAEGAITRGHEIEPLVQRLKQSGRIPMDAPEDHVHLKFDSSISGIVEACRKAKISVDAQTAQVLDFQSITPEMVSELQQHGAGVENVKIKELERAMVELCQARGIRILYKCGDVQVVKSTASNSITHVLFQETERIDAPDLVVICEGARRAISQQQLGLRVVRSSQSQWFVMFQLRHYYGPRAYTVINARDQNHPSTRLRHFLVGNYQTKQESFCALQLPPQFVGDLDDDESGGMLKAYCRDHLATLLQWHSLGPAPSDFEITWPPFESREMYLETCVVGGNTLVIGDAARSGSFLSGTGYNLALVNDLNALKELARSIIENKGDRMALMASLNAAITHTNRFFHALNLDRYY